MHAQFKPKYHQRRKSVDPRAERALRHDRQRRLERAKQDELTEKRH